MDTIKVSGTYEIEVKLYPEVSTKMKVVIIPQQLRRNNNEQFRWNEFFERYFK